jgi:small ligand-binding sensory domain FIST
LPLEEIETFHAVATIGDDDISLTGVPDFGEPALVALLVDPFTFPTGSFIDYVNETYPGLPLVGGIAAGGRAPGTQALIQDGEIYDEGALGAVVSGVPLRTVVSQGCAPIGRDAVITQADGNVVFELAGKPALERLREEIAALPREQQVLAAQGLLAGLVIDENKPEYGPGDFLIRGLLGADEETGALAVGEAARVGQTLRFHVRDATTAEEELRTALAEALAAETPAGALLFTCNGRGTRMFPAPDHDAKALAEALGSPTLAGFFCGGEIGPVGGRAFLHGFTATMAVFL